MSPRALSRRVRLSWSTPRRRWESCRSGSTIGVVRKQTTISNRKTLSPTSFPAGSSPRFVPLHCAGHASRLPRQGVCWDGLRCPGQDTSDVVRLPTSSSKTTAGRFARKVFGFHDLLSGVR